MDMSMRLFHADGGKREMVIALNYFDRVQVSPVASQGRRIAMTIRKVMPWSRTIYRRKMCEPSDDPAFAGRRR